MLSTTGWCLATWLKITALLGAGVLVVGLFWGFDGGLFVVAVVVAVVLDLLAIRGLTREWLFEARYTWWWLR
jgi:hypothetical protein